MLCAVALTCLQHQDSTAPTSSSSCIPSRLQRSLPSHLLLHCTPQAFTSKDGKGASRTQQAKDLLAQYGSAYLLTSISFAIVSFSACYALVNAGEPPPHSSQHVHPVACLTGT